MNSIDTSPAVSTPTDRLSHSRQSNGILAVLIFLLIFESIALIAMKTIGLKLWLVTEAYGPVGAAIVFSIAPLLIGFVLLVRRGIRFSLRTLLIVTACFGVFMGITLLPLVQAQQNRIASTALIGVDTQLHLDSVVSGSIRSFGIIDYADYEYVAVGPQKKLPGWLWPIAKKFESIPEDRQIIELDLASDIQLATAAQYAYRFFNVRSIIVRTCSSDSIAKFVKQLDRFPGLESMFLVTCQTPDDCFSGMKSIRVLSIHKMANSNHALSPRQIQDISQLPNLEVFSIANYPMTDGDWVTLAGCRTLKHVFVFLPHITVTERKAIADLLPECELHFFLDN